ncbi:MAG: cupin domain-containing protein [Sedimentisphaerales bacterium]|nr:cupin domain-containing protein [Sedimentisphaerales bacterium]
MPTVKDVIVKKPSAAEAEKCQSWPIWTCDVSTFDWDYTQTEHCLILEGKVTVKDRPGDEEVSFGPGDFVTFPIGLKCTWQVAEAVKKHYNFE